MAKQAVVIASALSRMYEIGETKVEVLRDINLSVRRGEFAAICGPSGSGKTTILNIIGGIDRPTGGNITVLGEDLNARDEDFLTDFRCNNVGFVFQSYNLVSTLTVAENVAFPMEWIQRSSNGILMRVDNLLTKVGVEHRRDHFPFQLSGGEQQRVAFARALANDPPLMLVDEPTGNLDAKTSLKVIEILGKLKDDGKTVIVATHDDRILWLADLKMVLDEGKLVIVDE